MGKELLVKGVVTGAVVGGLITLFDKDTRSFVSKNLQTCGSKSVYYVKHPADAIHQLNQGYAKCSKQLSSGLTFALDMLNQLQEVTQKVEKRDIERDTE
ncbi:hypothetical protein JCM21714_3564 [Gracilibacillus boraciitolerans JCM 21714]|uniref:YtxH domain-containing protein n=1 Tax=Gracilibacillus boraciitolerans JCM 21714 TaxID=1298598 RepID=W4VNV3_9BACI|nr:hypothetical protein [Gracilibacillus boraciitolerans]GAE94409.1 hypothetical protein JCM21714_3564 [Gracilibacillus boraciitolerans JCM 21714]